MLQLQSLNDQTLLFWQQSTNLSLNSCRCGSKLSKCFQVFGSSIIGPPSSANPIGCPPTNSSALKTVFKSSFSGVKPSKP